MAPSPRNPRLLPAFMLGPILAATLLFGAPARSAEPVFKVLTPDQDYVLGEMNETAFHIASKEGGGVDWVGYVIKLNAKDFASSGDLAAKAKDKRSAYPDEGAVVGTVYAEAKSVFRYLDVVHLLVDAAVQAVFQTDLAPTVAVAPDADAIYLVRAYSGGWGKTRDAQEKAFVRERINRGKERDQQALAVNIFAATLDGVSLFIPLDKTIAASDLKLIAAAGLTELTRALGQPDIMQGKGDAQDLLRLAGTAAKQMAAKTGEILAERATASTPTKNFFGFLGRHLELAASVVNIAEKGSKLGKIGDRIYQLVYTATPLETGYLVSAAVNEALAKRKPKPPAETWKTVTKDTFSLDIPTAWQEKSPQYRGQFAQAFRFTGPDGEYFEVGMDPTPSGLGMTDEEWELTVSGVGVQIASTQEIQGSLMGTARGNNRLEIMATAKTGTKNLPIEGHVYYFFFGNSQRETGVATQVFRQVLASFRAKAVTSAAPAGTVAAAVPSPAPAPSVGTTGKVMATVTNPASVPAQSAKVWLTDQQGNATGMYVAGIAADVVRFTEADGTVTTPNVPYGQYTLRVECSLNCFFGNESALKDDLYAKWVYTATVTIQQPEILLGKIIVVKE